MSTPADFESFVRTYHHERRYPLPPSPQPFTKLTHTRSLKKLYGSDKLLPRLATYLEHIATTTPLPGKDIRSLATSIAAKASSISKAFPALHTRFDMVVLETLMAHRGEEGWGPEDYAGGEDEWFMLRGGEEAGVFGTSGFLHVEEDGGESEGHGSNGEEGKGGRGLLERLGKGKDSALGLSEEGKEESQLGDEGMGVKVEEADGLLAENGGGSGEFYDVEAEMLEGPYGDGDMVEKEELEDGEEEEIELSDSSDDQL
ncbi:Hypothetical protein D9617_5g071270 [Elsinoe fawcettii]|nr:Hypothetical protein D9617_5g071270 [Elsinoe fawcettii]